jgi:hypothetical protein
MYLDLIKYPLRHENLRWEAGEAVLEMDGRPNLFVRIKLTGTEFPVIAQIPQVWVGKVQARKVLVDEDHRTVRAYFDTAPGRGNLYFGHLGRPELDFGPFDARRVERLDRGRLPGDMVGPDERR